MHDYRNVKLHTSRSVDYAADTPVRLSGILGSVGLLCVVIIEDPV